MRLLAIPALIVFLLPASLHAQALQSTPSQTGGTKETGGTPPGAPEIELALAGGALTLVAGILAIAASARRKSLART